jgi:DNA polymerase elongation subunit (family B)
MSPSVGRRLSPVRDLSAACSAVTLAYEKTYRPYLLLRKKNYAGLKYTSDGNGGFKTEIDMKGIDAVRRDRPKLLRDTSNAVLHALLFERSVDIALNSLKNSLQIIASDSAPLEDFVLSKSLKGHYASPNLPHVTAWRRMAARGDEGIPPIGARMPFVVVVDKAGGGGKKSSTKLYERTEHPSFVKSSNLTIDRQYYVETLKNPINWVTGLFFSGTFVWEFF